MWRSGPMVANRASGKVEREKATPLARWKVFGCKQYDDTDARLPERRPVELRPRSRTQACKFGAEKVRRKRFPRSKERGPIEAEGICSGFLGAGRFPRSKERGPIEAVGLVGYGVEASEDFRAQKSAAPLKPERLVTVHDPHEAFPRSKERGPIEAAFYPCSPV